MNVTNTFDDEQDDGLSMIMKDIEKVILAAVLIALIVTELEFTVVGVPDITPVVELRDNPDGREPE